MIDNDEIATVRMAIKRRFFQALDELIARRVLRGKKTFADRYGLDRRNLHRLQVDAERTIELTYLHYLARDFNVSSRWLLTGEGEMFAAIKNADSKTADV